MREVKYDTEGRLRMQVGYGENMRWRLAEYAECWFCGTTFPRVINTKRETCYCSKECRGRARQKLWASRRVTRRCSICLKNFRVQAATAYRYKTCGDPDCQYEWRKQAAKERQGQNGFGTTNQFRKRTTDGKFA